MIQIYESLVNVEFPRIHILLILLYKLNTFVVIWLPVVYLSSELKQSNMNLEAIAFKNLIRNKRRINLPKIRFRQFKLLF